MRDLFALMSKKRMSLAVVETARAVSEGIWTESVTQTDLVGDSTLDNYNNIPPTLAVLLTTLQLVKVLCVDCSQPSRPCSEVAPASRGLWACSPGQF